MSRVIFITLASALWVSPALSQQEDAPSLMERGIQQFLEGLLLEAEPALEGFSAFIQQMGPALADLMGEIEDWSAYEAPEVLENGDIIIRRKPREADEPQPGAEGGTTAPIDL
ncbi:hypothetical protein [uncultured Roseobacter sp.]|uniref:hypothetical protein n=1 Tax=uncultured Roseobacter sp. TaxID=114847 RepID=UPI00261C0F21|nr:hypothetical protein [uncultured Roseobacter sp.]